MDQELVRRIEEVLAHIDELTSGKGLRAAQRRALQQCRSSLDRMRRKLDGASGDEENELVDEVLAVLVRTCELVQAYFCRKGE